MHLFHMKLINSNFQACGGIISHVEKLELVKPFVTPRNWVVTPFVFPN